MRSHRAVAIDAEVDDGTGGARFVPLPPPTDATRAPLAPAAGQLLFDGPRPRPRTASVDDFTLHADTAHDRAALERLLCRG